MKVAYLNQQLKNIASAYPQQVRSKIDRYIELLNIFGHSLRMPYSKKLSTNLFELRIKGAQQVRLLYCFHQNCAVIIHCFTKKTSQISHRDLELAQQRVHTLQKDNKYVI